MPKSTYAYSNTGNLCTIDIFKSIALIVLGFEMKGVEFEILQNNSVIVIGQEVYLEFRVSECIVVDLHHIILSEPATNTLKSVKYFCGEKDEYLRRETAAFLSEKIILLNIPEDKEGKKH